MFRIIKKVFKKNKKYNHWCIMFEFDKLNVLNKKWEIERILCHPIHNGKHTEFTFSYDFDDIVITKKYVRDSTIKNKRDIEDYVNILLSNLDNNIKDVKPKCSIVIDIIKEIEENSILEFFYDENNFNLSRIYLVQIEGSKENSIINPTSS
jgi:hypothetical protein